MSVLLPKCRVITNCTSRKVAVGSALTLSKSELARSPAGVAQTWVSKLSAADRPLAAQDLYKGRSFSDAKKAAQALNAELLVISAGLGVIGSTDMVPHYSLTVAEGVGSVRSMLQRADCSSQDWWRLLNTAKGTPTPLSQKLSEDPGVITLIAAPSTYLEMVADDLMQLSDADLTRLRLLTSPAGAKALPGRLRAACLPYDARLEGHAIYAGTQADFPQRALRHFVEELKACALPIHAAQALVQQAMEALVKPTLPLRERRTDEEIVELISRNWDRFNGHREPLLRFLRDEAQVSCEQSRFGALWRWIKAQTLSA